MREHRERTLYRGGSQKNMTLGALGGCCMWDSLDLAYFSMVACVVMASMQKRDQLSHTAHKIYTHIV